MRTEPLSKSRWVDITPRLEGLLCDLKDKKKTVRYDLEALTKGEMSRLLSKAREKGGVYAFFKKKGGRIDYIGRSADLPNRIGNLHRGLNKYSAGVTKKIKKAFNYRTMRGARKRLYEEYNIGFVLEGDINTRAVFEVFAIIKERPKFNRLGET